MFVPPRPDADTPPVFRMVPIDEVFTWDSIDLCDGQTWEELIADKREDFDYEDLVESIAEHGFRSFICVYNGGEVPEVHNGHHRIAALMALGHNHIPCVFFDHDAWAYGEDAFLPIEVDKSEPDEVISAVTAMEPGYTW